jgi:hypothetical protein
MPQVENDVCVVVVGVRVPCAVIHILLRSCGTNDRHT